MENVIQVKALCSKYDDRLVLNGITMDVKEKEIMVILGGSGCGKSTLLKAIIGLHPPYSGSVRIFGQEVTTDVPIRCTDQLPHHW